MSWFATEIYALDPSTITIENGKPKLEPSCPSYQVFIGPPVKGENMDEAQRLCDLTQPYLKVVGQLLHGEQQGSYITDTSDQVAEPELPDDVEEVDDHIAEGDVVLLKSGGPLMTVTSANGSWTDVYFFVGTDLITQTFSTDALMIAHR